MKRTTVQIQLAVQEAEPNITDEELRLCVEAQRNIEHFYVKALLDLIQAIRDGRTIDVLKMKAEFAWGTHERMFAAGKRPPAEWLGPENIPGHPVQRLCSGIRGKANTLQDLTEARDAVDRAIVLQMQRENRGGINRQETTSQPCGHDKSESARDSRIPEGER